MIGLKKIAGEIKAAIKSPNGRNVLTFCVFLVIATLFWFLMSLNDEVQRDYELEAVITDVPEDMTLITPSIKLVHVSIKDKGSNLFSHDFGKPSKLQLSYNDFKESGKNKLTLSASQLSSAIRAYFGNSGNIISQSPDSIAVTYTTLPPVTVRLKINADVSASSQYIVFGPLRADTDTIQLFSAQSLKNIHRVETEPISLSNLTDTTVVEAKIMVPEGVRAIPPSVRVSIPVEPLIAKKRMVPVEILNVPGGNTVLTFPSSVELTYLLPMSLYNSDDFEVKAYADYSKRANTHIPLMLSILPDYYRGTSISPSSVEYVVEHN